MWAYHMKKEICNLLGVCNLLIELPNLESLEFDIMKEETHHVSSHLRYVIQLIVGY